MRSFPFPDLSEFRFFKSVDTTAKVQDFLNSLPINFEPDGETCRSPLATLRHGTAHCFEGAVLAAAAFWCHGRPPLLIDMETNLNDESHVIAPFRDGTRWGAVSKTNHAVLRYRDPVYADVRELVMSHFHEYFLDTGEKTLHAYSRTPLDLLEFEDDWLVARHPLRGVHDDLVAAPHTKITARAVRLRPADTIEIRAGTLTEWKRPS